MTNNPTIDGVSMERQRFEKFCIKRADRFHPDFTRRGLHPEAEYQNPSTQGDWEIWQGRALLDAPAVERQENKCGQCSASSSDICNQNGCGFLESGNGEPEVAAPQSPVAVVLTDEQILEVMRPAIYRADGGYVFDTAKEDVIEAGRALIACLDATAALNTPKPAEWHDVAGDDEGLVS